MKLLVLLCVACVAAVQYSVPGVTVSHKGKSYKLSFDEGQTWSPEYTTNGDIKLHYGTFDPLVSVPLQTKSAEDAKGQRPFLIQFHTMALPAYRAELERLYGATFYWSMPRQAYIMLTTDAKAALIRNHPVTRWVGDYQPAFKVHREVDQMFAKNSSTTRLNVMALKQDMQQTLAEAVTSMGGVVVSVNPLGYRMEVDLKSMDQVKTLSAHPYVLFMDLWSAPTEDMDIAREISGADYIESQGGYTGLGVPAEVCDSGLRTTHQDFRPLNLMIHGQNGASTSHGTSVFGIVFGNGIANRKGLGLDVNPSRAIFSAYGTLGNRYTHTQELVDPSGPYRAVFQTNSWGSAQTESYTSISAEMDDITFQTDLLILQSQSNTGNQRSRPQAWGKNILSVGGVKHKDTLTRVDDDWTRGASIGPAQDGRIKPDLWHFYDYIYTTSSSSDTGYTNFGGTSGATPITAGYAGLVFEMWSDGVFSGQPGQRHDVFDSRPHSATVKALMINSAFQYAFTGPSHDYSRYHQGWGMASINDLYDLAKDHGWGMPVLVNEESPIGQSQTHEYSVSVPPTTNPSFFRATLVYRDPAGSPSASTQLINNVNLRVTDPSGTVYWGNNGLTESRQSTPGGTNNLVDNVENVFVDVADDGQWKIEVIGTEIVDDAHLATPQADAAYALVVSYGAPGKKQL